MGEKLDVPLPQRLGVSVLAGHRIRQEGIGNRRQDPSEELGRQDRRQPGVRLLEPLGLPQEEVVPDPVEGCPGHQPEDVRQAAQNASGGGAVTFETM